MNSTTSNNMGPEAMTWASTWKMMNRTLEVFATETLKRYKNLFEGKGKITSYSRTGPGKTGGAQKSKPSPGGERGPGLTMA